MSYDEDPLDLLEDDEDGVIETILLLEDEEKDLKERVGCLVPIIGAFSSIGIGWWIFSDYLA